MFLIDQSNYPNSFDEATSCSKSDNWVKTMEEKLKSMQDNDVSDIVDLPDNFMPIG